MKYLILALSLFIIGCSTKSPKIGTCYQLRDYVVKLVNVVPMPSIKNEYMFQIIKPEEASWVLFTLGEDNFNTALKDAEVECPND